MSTESHVRLCIRNLPNDITADEVVKKFAKYGAHDADIKRRSLGDAVVTYAFVNVSEERAGECLKKYANKCWKGNMLSVETARQSFLDKLKKEREADVSALKGDKNRKKLNKFGGIRPVVNGAVKIENSSNGKVRVEDTMVKLENFSSVWRDSGEENDDIPPVERLLDFDARMKEEAIDENTADLKRVNALKQRWKTIEGKKKLIRASLRNINATFHPEVTFNSKKKFGDDGSVATVSEVAKIPLFADDDDAEDDYIPNFQSKPQFEGKSGRKLLLLKSKVADDDRFQIDERFVEDEGDRHSGNEEKLEKSSQLSRYRPLIRYDPAKDKQSLLPPASNSNKKKKGGKVKKKYEKAVETTPKPEVSKEKHYNVAADLLKNALRAPPNSFSLSAMFDEKIEKEKIKRVSGNSDIEEEECVNTRHPDGKQKVKKLNSFFENVSDMEEEERMTNLGDNDEDEGACVENKKKQTMIVGVADKILGAGGVWSDKFFVAEDAYFFGTEAEFLKDMKKTRENFDKRRSFLREILKRKLKNSRKMADEMASGAKNGGRFRRLDVGSFQKRMMKRLQKRSRGNFKDKIKKK